MQTSKYFKLHELIDKNTFINLGDDGWNLVNYKLIETLDTLKEIFNKGTITINNYKWGGNREWSGLRTKESKYYSKTSMHSLSDDGIGTDLTFKAIDCVFSDYSAEEVREYILNNSSKFPYITRLEDNVSWLHFDIKVTNRWYIVLFNA